MASRNPCDILSAAVAHVTVGGCCECDQQLACEYCGHGSKLLVLGVGADLKSILRLQACEERRLRRRLDIIMMAKHALCAFAGHFECTRIRQPQWINTCNQGSSPSSSSCFSSCSSSYCHSQTACHSVTYSSSRKHEVETAFQTAIHS